MAMKRRFILGEEWLYFKIYAGFSVQEFLLTNEVFDLVSICYSEALIDSFFFIRYSDSDGPHLRLRFKLTNENNINRVLYLFNRRIVDFVEKRIIHKVVYDTYNREIERYGADNIEDIETVFSCNSQIILRELHVMQKEERKDNRWVWGGKVMDDLLNRFGLSSSEKSRLYEGYYQSFEKEFSIKSLDKKKIAQRYREVRDEIDSALFGVDILVIEQPFYQNDEGAIDRIKERLKADYPSQSLDSLLRSLLHMHYNRLFKSEQRLHELVIYFIMSKIYKTDELRRKNKVHLTKEI